MDKSLVSQNPQELADMNTRLFNLAAADTEDVTALHKIEAGLCMYKPVDLLYPTYLRLRENLYRFEDKRRDAWQSDLASMFKKDVLVDGEESKARLRLSQLTLELYEAAEAWKRKAETRSKNLRSSIIFGMVVLILLLVGASFSDFLTSLMNKDTPLWVVPSALAGGSGAMVSILGNIVTENPREEYLSTLFWQMTSRTLLGVIYALVVCASTLAGYIPLRMPADPHQTSMFVLILAFAAGFTDRLFGQAIAQFIKTGSAASGKGTSRQSRVIRNG